MFSIEFCNPNKQLKCKALSQTLTDHKENVIVANQSSRSTRKRCCQRS